MSAERMSMRKIREALRLTHALGMSRRLVGEATGIGKTAVGEYVRRATVAGLSGACFRRRLRRRARRAPSRTGLTFIRS